MSYVTNNDADDCYLVFGSTPLTRAAYIKEELIKKRQFFIFLPPLTPMLNPTTNVFRPLKREVQKSRQVSDKLTLEDITKNAMELLSKKTFRKNTSQINFWLEKGLMRLPFDDEWSSRKK
jgi:transposase